MADPPKTLQDSLKSVVSLQRNWSAENTPAMQERGKIIRNRIPAQLKELSQQHGMEVEGRDGTGRKTRVPWVRIYHPRFSPSATEGWYVATENREETDRYWNAHGTFHATGRRCCENTWCHADVSGVISRASVRIADNPPSERVRRVSHYACAHALRLGLRPSVDR